MISSGKNFDRILFLLLIAFEALLCYNFYSREIAWYPPGNYDQGNYLATAYRIRKETQDKGVFELVRAIGSRFHFTGVALPIEGALSGLVFGGARLPELLVLFLMFCALQVVSFATACAVWGSRVYGYMLLGLILCQLSPWYWAGGLFDFRTDFSAYCLYGIWICAAIQSKLFLDRRWAIGCGFIGAFLVLNRFLSLVYILGVSAGFAIFCIAFGFFRRADSDLAGRMWKRLRNLVLSVGIILVIVTPFFIRSWPQLRQYYVVGHAVGNAKYARAHQEGLNSLSDHLLFYPSSILLDHLGAAFLLGGAIAIGSSLVARRLERHRASDTKAAPRQDELFLLQTIFLLGTILWPVIVLTADLDKSPVVGGVVGVPAALLVVVLAARAAAPGVRELEPSPAHKLVFICSLVIFALGVGNEFVRLSQHLPEYSQRRDLNRLVELDSWLVGYASSHGWSNPGISFDVLSPWLNAGGIAATGFEQSGKLIMFHPMLGDGIMGVERPEALSLLANSDFLILTTSAKTDVVADGLSLEASSDAIKRIPALRFRLFPFYDQIGQYWNDLKAWADKNMILAKTVQFDNFTATVYASEHERTAPSGEERK
jgi:hypothetical protein